MRVGVVREIKSDEFRVALTPAGARELAQAGHAVLVERGAGIGSGFEDDAYVQAGATMDDADGVWDSAELVVKVKEPIASEYGRLRPGQVLFTYLHLAADRALTDALLSSGATGIAYETVQRSDGSLPLLAPMSEVAGRLAPQAGAQSLERPKGGPGLLLAGIPGVPPAKVLVLGGGIVGYNAAKIAVGMGADVWLADTSLDRIRELEALLDGRARLFMSSQSAIEEVAGDADLIIGAVLVAGARAPKLISKPMLADLKGSVVLVDVAIDQGGCFETSIATTHSKPTFEVDGIMHYCVANMPGAVPVTSTRGLTNATLPYVKLLAERGLTGALEVSTALVGGVNIHAGALTARPVAESLDLEYTSLAAAGIGSAEPVEVRLP